MRLSRLEDAGGGASGGCQLGALLLRGFVWRVRGLTAARVRLCAAGPWLVRVPAWLVVSGQFRGLFAAGGLYRLVCG